MNKLNVLNNVFGYPNFRNDQDIIIDHITNPDIDGVLVVMATGGGKSILYQIPAIIGNGLTLVISPLISLMKDQVDFLNNKGIPSAFYNSTLSSYEKDQVEIKLATNQLKLLYVAPERFEDPTFINKLPPINIFAVDESHCISTWGHDFRPSYRLLSDVINTVNPNQVVALTATATAKVQDDICNQLNIPNAKRFIKGFYRDDLWLNIIPVNSGCREDEVFELLEVYIKHNITTGIVYCQTRGVADEIQDKLKLNRQILTYSYHAGQSDKIRAQTQENWLANGGIIIATIAFGMGIDKSDVRFVIHNGISGSIENYYQEIGRASRDGKGAVCTTFYDFSKDVRMQRFFIDLSTPPSQKILQFWNWCMANSTDDGKIYKTQKLMEKESKVGCVVGGCIGQLKKNGFMKTLKRGQYEINKAKSINSFDFETLNKRRTAKLETLQIMLDFISNATKCRMLQILEYFNDTNNKLCGHCDVCRQSSEVKKNVL